MADRAPVRRGRAAHPNTFLSLFNAIVAGTAQPFGVRVGEKVRLLVLDVPGTTLIITVDAAAAADFPNLAAECQPVLLSLHFS